ncbi:adenylate cyclase, putative [Bodo saltans]|uniref:Adenylate cyclase, putative n=1 Tax=Bodo saltans TaxID=75058 RepID=A0A0S4JQ54_BODSA|nr:adenylate cyclase, putative [Bodo saltans]|eukprot:CUG92284.1 adenylate cyclase, putative [Bodo saltans]
MSSPHQSRASKSVEPSSADSAAVIAGSADDGSSSSSSALSICSPATGTRREPLLFIPCIVLTLVLLAVNVGYTQTRYGRQSKAKDAEGMLPRLSTFIIQATNEMTASTTFLTFRNYSLTDRQQVFPLTAMQDKTLFLLQDLQTFYEYHYPTTPAPLRATTSGEDAARSQRNPYEALSFSALRAMQYGVQQRGVFATDVIAFYDTLRLNALRLMGYFAAEEVPKANALLYASIKAAFMNTRNALDRVGAAQTEGLAQAGVSSLTVAARSNFDNLFLRSQLLPMLTSLDTYSYHVAAGALSENVTMATLQSSYQKTGTWDIQVSGPFTPTETLNNLTAMLTRIRNRYEASRSATRNSDGLNYRSVILASTVMGALIVVLAAVVWRGVQAVIQEAHDALETTQMLALEASHQRMVRFLTSIGTMHVAGIKSADGRNVQTVERDVYALEQPTKQLLSFLHPALAVLRTQFHQQQLAQNGMLTVVPTLGSGKGDADGDVTSPSGNGGGISSSPHRGASSRNMKADANNEEMFALGATANGASPLEGNESFGKKQIGGGLRGGGIVDDADSVDLIPRKLRSVAVSLVAIDLDNWQSRVTSESAKVVPRDFVRFVGRVTQIIQQHGGVVHETSSSRMLAAWNLCDDCHETESQACQAVLALHKNLSTDYPFVKFAVVTGECSVGVVGTESLKTFACVGPVLPLVALLMKLNRVHNAVCVIDDITFAKLDGQTFRTRPLEVVAIDVQSRRTVAFELLTSASPSDKDGRNASWNEAFDEYKSGNMERAKYLLRKWQQSFGETRSILRLLNLITEDPPRLCTYKHNEDGLLEDELL